jgi:hypothetical protein
MPLWIEMQKNDITPRNLLSMQYEQSKECNCENPFRMIYFADDGYTEQI